MEGLGINQGSSIPINKEIKQESSIPVQSRVSFMSLARLHMYWVREGYSIKTMSQLVSWSVDLLCEVLEANEKMPEDIDSLAKAHRYLQIHGLYQGSTKKLAMKKIGTALRFEALREHGIDPKSHIPLQHKMLHKEGSVEPLECMVDAGRGTSDEEWERIQERIKEENEKDRIAQIKTAVGIARASGLTVSEVEEKEPEKLSQEDVRARYFKRLAEVRKEHPELSGEEMKVKVQAELRNEIVAQSDARNDPGPSVKEGMTDEEYEVKVKEIKERDEVRLELEKGAEVSEDNIVKEDSDNVGVGS